MLWCRADPDLTDEPGFAVNILIRLLPDCRAQLNRAAVPGGDKTGQMKWDLVPIEGGRLSGTRNK